MKLLGAKVSEQEFDKQVKMEKIASADINGIQKFNLFQIVNRYQSIFRRPSR